MEKITAEHLGAIRQLVKAFQGLKVIEPALGEFLGIQERASLARKEIAGLEEQKKEIDLQVVEAKNKQRSEFDRLADEKKATIVKAEQEVEEKRTVGYGQVDRDLKKRSEEVDRTLSRVATRIAEQNRRAEVLRSEVEKLTATVKSLYEERSKLQDTITRLERTQAKYKKDMDQALGTEQ